MQPAPHLNSRIRSAEDLRRRRTAAETPPIAVITGSFDLLQPGNFSLLQAALRREMPVWIVLETDDAIARHAGPGRPQNSLAQRAELAAHLKGVAAVTTLAVQDADPFFRAVRPYVLVTCRAQAPDVQPLQPAAAEWADGVIDVPLLPGATTQEIHRAIRSGRTPLALPAATRAGWAAWADAAAGRPPQSPLVTVNGCFDILHAGHLSLLREARALGAELAVLINSDRSVARYKGPARPVFPDTFRRVALLALEPVGRVLAFDDDNPLRLLRSLQPAVHVKGGSFEPERVAQESELVASWGGRVAFCPLRDQLSTTRYIDQVLRGTGAA